jgi:hypothetical protein
MKQKMTASHYLRRAAYYLRRAMEIWLFTHTPCPSRVVTDVIAREDREQRMGDRAREKRHRTHRQSSAVRK